MKKVMRPKRLLLVTALLSAAAAADLHAQVGIKGGVSHGRISNAGLLPGDLGGRTGFAVGFSFATAPSPFGVGVEALYAQRGARSANNPSSRELDYVDIPVYLRVMAAATGLAPYVYAGPQVSFEIQCDTGLEDCPDTGRSTATYSGVIGAGVHLVEALSIEGRYMYGLSDLDLETVTDEESYRNRSFMILAGITF
jgi:hypothetical protein